MKGSKVLESCEGWGEGGGGGGGGEERAVRYTNFLEQLDKLAYIHH